MGPPRRASPRAWRDRRGVAALEMALAAPFFLLVLMICVDFGRAISQSIDLTHAVRAGAQFAATAPNAQALIEGTIRTALPPNLSAATVTTACYCGALPNGGVGMPPAAACDTACPAASARMMTLRASLPFQPHTFVLGRTIATAVGLNQVVGNVTVRHQ